MKITDLSIRRPVTIVMVVCIVLLLGFISLTNLNMDLFPEMNLPVAVVITQYSGTGPQEMETLVTRPLEETLSTVHNVEHIQSFSRMGVSVVIVQFSWGTDMDFATLEMREKVDLVEGMLPAGIEDPLIFKMDPNMMPVMTLALSGDINQWDLKQLAEDEIKNRLERIEGVASVDVLGGLEREISVEVKPEVLQAYGISLSQIIQTLRAENLNVSGGEAFEGDKEYLIRVLGQFAGVEEIGELRVSTPSGADLRLGDIADIKDGFKDVEKYSTIDGKPSVALFVNKQSDANTVKVARGVQQAIKELQERLPDTVEITTVVDQSEFIEKSIYNVVQNIIVGGLLAIIILFVFLRNIRSTLIIGIAIPISVIATFVLIYFGGLTLNMMTLGGLALGVGMMVDNSIVVLENIFRHRQQGADPIEAARVGSSEMALAITASTLTTISVFFPVVFVKGLASQIFSPLALTVSFALLASLAVALSLIPMMASQMLIPVPEHEKTADETRWQRFFRVTGKWLDTLNDRYRNLLEWALGHKRAVLLITGVTLVASLMLIPLVGIEFIPQMDEGLLSVNIELPHGTKLQRTEEIVARVKKIIEAQPEVETVFVTVGSRLGQSSGFMSGEGQSEYARVDVQLVDKNKRQRSTEDVVEVIRKKVQLIPGAEFEVAASDPLMPGGGGNMGAGTPIAIEIKGQELDTLKDIASDVAEMVASVQGTAEVKVSLENSSPEVQVVVDRAKAALYGLSASQVAGIVQASIDGQVATRYRTGEDEIDVRVRLSTRDTSMQDLLDLKLMTPMGVQIPLSEIGEVKIAEGPNVIERRDQMRTVVVTSELHGRDLGHVMQDIRAKIDKYVLPAGYTIEYGGESKEMAEAFGDLGTALIIAIVLVYMILAAQFESFVHPLVIMFSMPVSIVGVVAALLITAKSFSVPTFIGVIMLAGIVVNNAIVLVDYINQLRARGFNRDEAILMAGPHRLRPILMTALTTILAMVPLALGMGEGAEVRAPMAVAVIGGLSTSTLLTLVVIPVMYVIFDNMAAWVKSKMSFSVPGGRVTKMQS